MIHPADPSLWPQGVPGIIKTDAGWLVHLRGADIGTYPTLDEANAARAKALEATT